MDKKVAPTQVDIEMANRWRMYFNPLRLDDLAQDFAAHRLTSISQAETENARLTEERDALVEASAYLIDRLTKISGGIVVRDLEEARGSYDAALAKVKGGPDAR